MGCLSTFSPPPRRSHGGSLAASATRILRYRVYISDVRAFSTCGELQVERRADSVYEDFPYSAIPLHPSVRLNYFVFALMFLTASSSFNETAFLYYDHLVTFPEEVRKIWRRRLTFLNILFIINRYTVCFGYIPIIYFTFNSPTDTAVSRILTFLASLLRSILDVSSRINRGQNDILRNSSRCAAYIRYPAILSIVTQTIITSTFFRCCIIFSV